MCMCIIKCTLGYMSWSLTLIVWYSKVSSGNSNNNINALPFFSLLISYAHFSFSSYLPHTCNKRSTHYTCVSGNRRNRDWHTLAKHMYTATVQCNSFCDRLSTAIFIHFDPHMMWHYRWACIAVHWLAQEQTPAIGHIKLKTYQEVVDGILVCMHLYLCCDKIVLR